MPRSVLVTGSPEQQRPDERVAYGLKIHSSYPSPSDAVSKLYDLSDGSETDVTSSKLSGSGAIAASTEDDAATYPYIFTSPLAIALVAGKAYRLEFQFVSGGSTFEPYLIINGVA